LKVWAYQVNKVINQQKRYIGGMTITTETYERADELFNKELATLKIDDVLTACCEIDAQHEVETVRVHNDLLEFAKNNV
jgi:hypothetical protein